MKLEVVTPEENMGDVIGDLNKRRGQVEGMESSRSGARIVTFRHWHALCVVFGNGVVQADLLSVELG